MPDQSKFGRFWTPRDGEQKPPDGSTGPLQNVDDIESWGDVLQTDIDLLEEECPISGPNADKPPADEGLQLYYATDIERWYYNDGGTWVQHPDASSGGGSANWFDVTEAKYGAAGDGTTDDQPAIQAAVDDASSVGGIVYFPYGEYLIESRISVQAGNVTLMGTPSWGSTIAAGASLSGSIIDGETGGASHVVVRDLVLDGTDGWQNDTYAPRQKAIRTKLGSHWEVSNCYILNTAATGIGLDSVKNDRYLYNRLENCGTAGETQGSNGIGIGVGEVTGRCPTYCIGNTIINTAEYGIILEQTGDFLDTTDATIIGNMVDQARGGVVGELMRRVVCHGNITNQTGEYGIYFGPLDSSRGCRFASVKGNVVRNHNVTHNGVDYNQPHGIRIDDPTDYCWAHGNVPADSSVRIRGSLNIINGTGREAAGTGNPPTAGDWHPHFNGIFVQNSSDGTLWHLDLTGTFQQIY